MKAYRNWFVGVVGLTILLMVGIALFNYVIDPLQFYRKTRSIPHFSNQERYQNPGLAKHYDYDTIVLGTSMTQNFVPSYLDRMLSARTLKLSIAGSTSKEQNIIASVAIRTGKVKRVLWGIDYFSLRGSADRVREDYGPFPYYLYDTDLWNDLQYLYSYSTTYDALKGIALNMLHRDTNSDLDHLNNWSAESVFSKDKVWGDWDQRSKDPASFKPEEYAFGKLKANVDTNIVSLVREHPEISFDILYPPPSILLHRFFYERSHEAFRNETAIKRYIFKQIGAMPNVRVYDFQADRAITHRLENYKDMTHFSQGISNYLVDSMAAERYRVTTETLESDLSRLNDQVTGLRLDLLK